MVYVLLVKYILLKIFLLMSNKNVYKKLWGIEYMYRYLEDRERVKLNLWILYWENIGNLYIDKVIFFNFFFIKVSLVVFLVIVYI